MISISHKRTKHAPPLLICTKVTSPSCRIDKTLLPALLFITPSGLLFTLASGISSVPSGQSLLVQVTNPGGSGKTMYISRIIGGITAAATLTIASGGTFTAAATPDPFNMNFGSATASSMTTKTATGTLGGSPVSFTAILAAAGQYTIGFGGGIVVPPGGVLTFSAGTGALNASANIMWWEF